MTIVRWLSLLLLSVGWNAAVAAQAPSWEWQFSWRSGKVDGFTQTPTGGQPGSSSPERPDFAELGYDDAHRPRLGLSWPALGIEWQLQAERLRLGGRQTLQQDLITRGVWIPAGSELDSTLQFDWYSASARQSFWSKAGWQADWQLALIGVDFESDIRIEGNHIRRAYSSKGVQAGLSLRYQLAETVALQLSGRRGYRAAHFVALDDWALALEWQHSCLTLIGELGAFSLSYRDHQPLPNRLQFEQAETVGFGLVWQF